MGWMERWQQRPRVQQWMNRRLPPIKAVVLNQKRIFIFLSAEGALFTVLLLITFIAGINYANNLILGFCFLLASILVVSIHHTFAHLSGLKIEVLYGQDSEVGGTARYHIQLAATGQQPHRQLWLQWGAQSRLLDAILAPQVVVFDLPTQQRGQFFPDRLKISTVYPLGILRAWTYIRFDESVWVAPASLPCDLPRQSQQAAWDDDSVERVDGQDEFEELKSFIPGESMARISWAHLARGQGLLSKRFTDAQGQEQSLNYLQMPAMDHESKLSQLAYWVRQFEQQQIPYELVLPNAQLPIGVGSAHSKQALRLLAEHP